jgi:hypothetical protein
VLRAVPAELLLLLLLPQMLPSLLLLLLLLLLSCRSRHMLRVGAPHSFKCSMVWARYDFKHAVTAHPYQPIFPFVIVTQFLDLSGRLPSLFWSDVAASPVSIVTF